MKNKYYVKNVMLVIIGVVESPLGKITTLLVDFSSSIGDGGAVILIAEHI